MAGDLTQLEAAVVAVATKLDDLGIAYMIIGGFAATILGEPHGPGSGLCQSEQAGRRCWRPQDGEESLAGDDGGKATARAHTVEGLVVDWEAGGAALRAVGEELGIAIPAGASRRQIVIRGLALNPTVGQTQRGGEVMVAVTSRCDPCVKMEDKIGPGARAALTDREGVCARVLAGGILRVGDAVAVEPAAPAAPTAPAAELAATAAG